MQNLATMVHFHPADTSESRRTALLAASDSRSPRAIEIETHCPERFNKIVFHLQGWAPSHPHSALPSSSPWLTGEQGPRKRESAKEDNYSESKQLQHRIFLSFWAVAVTETTVLLSAILLHQPCQMDFAISHNICNVSYD